MRKLLKNTLLQYRTRVGTIVIIVLFIGLSQSCKRVSSEQSNAAKEPVTGFGDQTEEQIREVYYRFPSPSEMLTRFEQGEMEFMPHLLLPTEKSKQYIDSKSQSLNLGVYIADLAYASIFHQPQEVNNYMMTVYNMSDKLRIASAFEKDMLKRIEENIENIDSLSVLSVEAVRTLSSYLERYQKEKTLILISIGGYVESLYLTFHMVGEFSEENIFVQRIADQKYVLNNLINFAVQYTQEQDVAEAIEMLHPIRDRFANLVVQKVEKKVEKTSEGTLVISGGDKYLLTKDQYNDLRQVVLNIRRQITEAR